MSELRDARVLLTGASGGLGMAIARTLGARGAALVLTGRRAETLEPLAKELGGRPIVADLADRADLDRLVEEAGELDMLVANAALPASGELTSFSQAEVDRALEVNLRAPIALTRAMLPALQARGRGHLVYISSLAGKVAPLCSSLYSATKFGLRGFAASLRADLHGSGVGVSVVSPGFVRDAGMFAESGAKLPPGVGTVTPEAVADAVARAITTNRAEIDVAPLPLRLGATLGSLYPGMSARIQVLAGSEVAHRIAEGQRSKR